VCRVSGFFLYWLSTLQAIRAPYCQTPCLSVAQHEPIDNVRATLQSLRVRDRSHGDGAEAVRTGWGGYSVYGVQFLSPCRPVVFTEQWVCRDRRKYIRIAGQRGKSHKANSFSNKLLDENKIDRTGVRLLSIYSARGVIYILQVRLVCDRS